MIKPIVPSTIINKETKLPDKDIEIGRLKGQIYLFNITIIEYAPKIIKVKESTTLIVPNLSLIRKGEKSVFQNETTRAQAIKKIKSTDSAKTAQTLSILLSFPFLENPYIKSPSLDIWASIVVQEKTTEPATKMVAVLDILEADSAITSPASLNSFGR